MDRKRVFFLLLLLATPVYPRRSGGSSGNRGVSGARGNSGPTGGGAPSGGNGFRPQTGPSPNSGGGNFNNGGNFNGGRPPVQPQQPRPNTNNIGFGNNGGGRPNTQPGGFNNNHGGGGFVPPRQQPFGGSSFNPGTGPGSRSSSIGWKTALAGGAIGAVGGVLAWEAGKAIIRNANEPFNHGGRNYYWDDKNYKQQQGMMQCSVPLETLQKELAPATTTTTTTTAAPVVDGASTTTAAPTTVSPDQVLNTISFADGTRPKTVTWGCRAGSEVCCNTDCCPAPQQAARPNGGSGGGGGSSVGTIVAMVLIFLLLLCCCGCFIVYKCFGGLFDACRGEPKHDQQYDQGQAAHYNGGEYPMQQYGQQPQYSQGYPPQQQQQYPNQGYPPQPQYPNNQYPPQPYPNHPQY